MSRLKDAIAFGWTGHPVIFPFLMGWFLSTLSVIFLMPTHIVQLILLVGAIFFLITCLDRWSKHRIVRMYVDLKESGQFDELKETLMEEARKMSKQQKERVLIAHCYECECQIFEDDSIYIDGPGREYCIVCCDDLEKQEETKKDRICMCHHCGAKFAPWEIVTGAGDSVGEATKCCIGCADLGAPTE